MRQLFDLTPLQNGDSGDLFNRTPPIVTNSGDDQVCF
jgi:hypothetical protein